MTMTTMSSLTLSATQKTKSTQKALHPSTKTKFDMAETLVSDCYVPEKDRRWNEVSADIVLQPLRALPTSERQAEFLRQTLCPTIPLVSHEILLQQQQAPHDPTAASTRIPFRSFPSDIYYATHKRALAQKSITDNDTVSLPCLETLCVGDTNNDSESQEPSSNDSSKTNRRRHRNRHRSEGKKKTKEPTHPLLHQYATALESLLFAERQEILNLYERYSQYQTKRVSFLEPTTPGSSPSIVIEIDGIADAAPAVSVGDILLLRPCALAEQKVVPYNNPRHLSHTNPYFPPSPSSLSRDMMEIQCQVLHISRGRGKACDRIQATWLEPSQLGASELAYKYRIPPALLVGGSAPVNIRIVPTPIPVVRQLTATDWLRSSIAPFVKSATTMSQTGDAAKPSPLHAMQELLFPTKAVSLPPISGDELFGSLSSPAFSSTSSARTIHTLQQLNAQQLSFVRTMMQRTKHFSTEEIRGPAILSGTSI